MSEPTSSPVSCAPTCVGPAADHARWFHDEVHPLDAQLKSYLRGSFPAVRDVDDVVQESYLRIWKARASHPIQSAKAFLFTVARRLAIDWTVREHRSPIDSVGDVATLPVLEDGPAFGHALDDEEKIRLLCRAVAVLPARCRAIVTLHKIQGLSQREVAARLGLTEKAIEHHVARGVKRCEAYFRTHGIEYF